MLVELDLGRLDLESKISGLQLKLSSSAKFAPSAEDAIDELRSRLTACQPTLRLNCRPWIRGGNAFKLVLSLQLEAVMKRNDQGQDLIEALSAQLRVAKVPFHAIWRICPHILTRAAALAAIALLSASR